MTCTSLLAHQLSVRFGSGRVARQVLDGVSIAFQTGSVTLLKGPSGSGKTTLLSVLGGLLRPHEGRVELQGADLYAGGDRVAAGRRRHFGFVFQAAQLFPTLRVIENVRMPLDLLAIDRTTANARARSLLASVGLSDRCEARPRELSGGEQQRVAIARALAADPDVLLADEPTAALDAMGGLDIAVILRRAASEFGKTVVIVSHDDRLTPAADRIVGLVDGRIVSDEKRGSR